MKRIKKKLVGKTGSAYPDVKAIRADRAGFLRALKGGLLGLSVVGMAGACDDPGEKIPVDNGDVQPADVLSNDQFGYELMGGAPMPDTTEEPDLWLVELMGLAPEDVVDVVLGGEDTGPADVEEEFPPLAGDPRPPDEDIVIPDVQEVDVPPMAGDMPMPDMVETPDVVESSDAGDAAGETDSEFPPLDGDMALPTE